MLDAGAVICTFQNTPASPCMQLERMWDIMISECGFDQSRGWVKEKRGTHKMNIYIESTGECAECFQV